MRFGKGPTECRPGCRARGFSSFHHETVGSGWPQGGSHCRSTCSPTAATVSRGWIWKSSWSTAGRTEGWPFHPGPTLALPTCSVSPAFGLCLVLTPHSPTSQVSDLGRPRTQPSPPKSPHQASPATDSRTPRLTAVPSRLLASQV